MLPLARPGRGRSLAVATAVVFFISSAFPVVAGLSKNTASFPKWWSVLDVGLAFVLAILAFGLMGGHSRQGGQASLRRQLPRLSDS
jgi:hypothetical protein